jgi:hypothetical protein
MSRRVEHGEAGHLVAFAQTALHGVRFRQGHPGEQPRRPPLALFGARALGDVSIALAAPERDAERLADGVTRAEVVGMGVREGVGRTV